MVFAELTLWCMRQRLRCGVLLLLLLLRKRHVSDEERTANFERAVIRWRCHHHHLLSVRGLD
jgi:hypothetical protein